MSGKIGIIIGREFRERVCKKSFIITTLLTPLLLIGLMVGAGVIMALNSGDTKRILVIDASGEVASRLESDKSIEFLPTDRSLEELRAGEQGENYGILVVGASVIENPSDVTLYTWSSPTMEVESAVARGVERVVESERLKGYDIENLPQIMQDVKADVTLRSFKIGAQDEGDKESSSALSFGLSYLFGFLMYMFVLLYGAMVMQGVIEEKNSKVLEVMVSTVRPYQLMMGKILGIASVAVLQFLIWVLFISVAGGVVMHLMLPEAAMQTVAAGAGSAESLQAGVDPEMVSALANITDVAFLVKLLGGFLVYFIGGYLLYAAMFAAVGSAVENVQDAQQFQTPITLPIILGLLLMFYAMKEPHSSLAVWASIIPFTSPIVMIARLPYDVPVWQVALSLAVLVASFAAMVWVAAKIYRIGIFMHGRKPSFKDLAKWVTMKD